MYSLDAWCVVEHLCFEDEGYDEVKPKCVFLRYESACDLAERWNKLAIDSWYEVRAVCLDIEDYSECTCHNYGGQEGTNGEMYDFACDACGFACDIPQPNYCPGCGAKVLY